MRAHTRAAKDFPGKSGIWFARDRETLNRAARSKMKSGNIATNRAAAPSIFVRGGEQKRDPSPAKVGRRREVSSRFLVCSAPEGRRLRDDTSEIIILILKTSFGRLKGRDLNFYRVLRCVINERHSGNWILRAVKTRRMAALRTATITIRQETKREIDISDGDLNLPTLMRNSDIKSPPPLPPPCRKLVLARTHALLSSHSVIHFFPSERTEVTTLPFQVGVARAGYGNTITAGELGRTANLFVRNLQQYLEFVQERRTPRHKSNYNGVG